MHTHAASVLALAFALLALAQDNQTYAPGAYPFPLPPQPGAVSQTTFNPAIQNIGGSTNAAGTFNVQTIAGTSSHVFQPPQQTSSFVPGAPVFNSGAPQASYSAAPSTSVGQLSFASTLFTSTGSAPRSSSSSSSPAAARQNAAVSMHGAQAGSLLSASMLTAALFAGAFAVLA